MPTIEFSYKDLCKLMGKEIPFKKFEEEAVLYVKGEVEGREGDDVKIELADTNRPDLWSVEGVARELRGRLGLQPGLPEYKMKPSGVKVIVHDDLKKIRPLTVCAVVRNVKMSDDFIKQLVQLQEKICDTFGRKRDQAAIGIYDLHKIKSPIHFKSFHPDKLKFRPLDYPNAITLRQILSKHPKGRDYAHLLEDKERYPVFIDSADEVLSMPPVINSDYTGKVTLDTKDLFIECSGWDFNFVMPSLTIMALAFAERGAELQSVEVEFKDKSIGTMYTPDLKPKKINVEEDFVNKRIGVEIPKKDIIKLLKNSRFDVKEEKGKFEVSYPPYRSDIMHPVDVVEEVLIGYGYNNIEPKMSDFVCVGKIEEIEVFKNKVANIMVGLGSQEVMSYTLTNKEFMFKNMNLEEGKVIEVDNPVSKNWSVFRTWILPCLLELFSKNKNQEYPQDVFEAGQVVLPNDKAETRAINPTRLAWARIANDCDFTTAKQALDFLLSSLGVEYSVEEVEHPSFISGRVGRVKVGKEKVAYIGEIHPQVLENWGLELPVVGFELNLTDLMKAIKK